MSTDEVSDGVLELRRLQDGIRSEMGGPGIIAKLHQDGRATIRERIEMLCDAGSFREIGTFVRSEREEDRDRTPGDGKIGGHGTVAGRAVTVVGDDVTVRAGTSATMSTRRQKRLLEHALRAGNPFVYLGESSGARIPDALGAVGLTEMAIDQNLPLRGRRVPIATAIMGRSFGGSSFVAAQSDFVVQLRGSCMAITSPRLIEAATGEAVTSEELGGVDVHMRKTGQVDQTADDEAEAIRLIRSFLSYMPQNSVSVPARALAAGPVEPDPSIGALVPSRIERAYDMRRVLKKLSDDGDFLELQPLFGRGLLAGLLRVGGFSVGVLASQPKMAAGSLDPDACDKATRLVCLCEAFNLPLVFMQDVPGFMVGKTVEHNRLLNKAIMLQQALALSTMPKITFVLRKAFGMAYLTMGGIYDQVDRLYAWPDARFGLMDSKAGGHVVAGNQLSGLDAAERRQALERAGESYASEFNAYGPAARMKIDEIIEPADTRGVLIEDLERLVPAVLEPTRNRPLLTWPTRW